MDMILETDLGTPPVEAETTVAVTIDGREVRVAEGTSILRAAALAGVDIPRLCATDSLAAFGSCRLCLVEIEGRGGTPASVCSWRRARCALSVSSVPLNHMFLVTMRRLLVSTPSPTTTKFCE